MSQMHYDEAGQERQRPEFDNSYDAGYSPGFRDPFMGSSGQKLSMPTTLASDKSASAGQRLALAIVSVIMLIGAVAIIFDGGNSPGGFIGLVALGVVSAAIVAVNVVFNNMHFNNTH